MNSTNSAEDITDIIPFDNYESEAQSIIRKYTLASTGLGFIPNPIVNVGSTASTQIMMIRELCELFNVPFNKNLAGVALNAVLGSMVTKAAGMLAAIFIPGAKPMARFNLAGGGISGLYTNTVGEFYKIHFQKGGSLKDASITDLSKYFKEEYERGDIGLNNLSPMNILKGFWPNK